MNAPQIFPETGSPETGLADPAAAKRFALPATTTGRLLWAIGALFATLFLLAALVPIGGAVLGLGRVAVESRVKRVAHPTGGVISAILIRDGDAVKAGDLLMRLDTTVSGARADLSGRSVAQLLAQQARLEAEREALGSISFPDRLSVTAQGQAATASELRLFALRRSERATLQAQLRERVVQSERQIAGFRAQIVALNKQQGMIESERAGVEELWDQGLVTVTRRNALGRASAELEGSVASLQASIAQAAARISETREQMIQVDQSARSEAASELAQVNSALNQMEVEQVSASDAFDRSEIRAPQGGIVDKLAFAAIGDVVQPAQTILEIVPGRDRLIVEVQVSPADIDEVRPGQEARVRFSSLPLAQSPERTGLVEFVSAERTTEPDTGATYFRARIVLSGEGASKALKPGIPAEVFISTGSRSMLSYLTKPLTDQFARAFRD